MSVTIATHNGSRVARGHNKRDSRIVSKESHINPEGISEIWIDEDPRDAYERIFGDAVREYNRNQDRKDRQISNYYNAVSKDAKKHPVYEMIIGVYGYKNYKNPMENLEERKEIMRYFVDTWKDRNPNLELIGAYYHADEEGEPHVHLDYIPVAEGYTRGMRKQNGLVKALKTMGFEKSGKETAQIQWQRSENKFLEGLCNTRNLYVDHPMTQKPHIDTPQYKQQQQNQSLLRVLQGFRNWLIREKLEDKLREDKALIGDQEFLNNWDVISKTIENYERQKKRGRSR